MGMRLVYLGVEKETYPSLVWTPCPVFVGLEDPSSEPGAWYELREKRDGVVFKTGHVHEQPLSCAKLGPKNNSHAPRPRSIEFFVNSKLSLITQLPSFCKQH